MITYSQAKMSQSRWQTYSNALIKEYENGTRGKISFYAAEKSDHQFTKKISLAIVLENIRHTNLERFIIIYSKKKKKRFIPFTRIF